MSITVYHGGTPISDDFKRPFEATNGGSTGYYVTTNRDFAAGYGPVHTYAFDMGYDMTHNRLTPFQAAELSERTRYWEQYSEDPDNPTPIEALTSDYVYGAMMDCINATGEIKKVIDYLLAIGYNYASQPAYGVFIVIGELQEISIVNNPIRHIRRHSPSTHPTIAWPISASTIMPEEFNQFIDDGRIQLEKNILGNPEVSIYRKIRGELVLHQTYSISDTLFIVGFESSTPYPHAMKTKDFQKKYNQL